MRQDNGYSIIIVVYNYCYRTCLFSGSFLKYLLNCLSSKNVPDLPMVYVSYALSCMECSSPGLLKSDSLPAMRQVLPKLDDFVKSNIVV